MGVLVSGVDSPLDSGRSSSMLWMFGGFLRSYCCRRIFHICRFSCRIWFSWYLGMWTYWSHGRLIESNLAFIWHAIMVYYHAMTYSWCKFRVLAWYFYLKCSFGECYLLWGDKDHVVMFMFFIHDWSFDIDIGWFSWYWVYDHLLDYFMMVLCCILSLLWIDWLQVLMDTWTCRCSLEFSYV